jgi:hypothetical protein
MGKVFMIFLNSNISGHFKIGKCMIVTLLSEFSDINTSQFLIIYIILCALTNQCIEFINICYV